MKKLITEYLHLTLIQSKNVCDFNVCHLRLDNLCYFPRVLYSVHVVLL